MKRKSFNLAAAILAIAIIPSCASSKKDNWEINYSGDYMIDTTGVSFNLRDFDAVQNDIAADIVYTQGGSYDVSITGNEQYTSDLVAYVTPERVLVLKKKESSRGWQGKLTVRITAPQINRIKNNGVLFFAAKSLSVDKMTIDNRGSLKTDVTSMKCRAICIENSGVFTQSGNLTAKETLTIENKGSLNFSGEIDAKAFTLKNSGVLKGKMKYRGEGATIDNKGSGRIEFDCDCRKLWCHNSGVATITLSGTADETEVKSTGVSKIDCTRLNRF